MGFTNSELYLRTTCRGKKDHRTNYQTSDVSEMLWMEEYGFIKVISNGIFRLKNQITIYNEHKPIDRQELFRRQSLEQMRALGINCPAEEYLVNAYYRIRDNFNEEEQRCFCCRQQNYE